ncbi:hypothetical protein H0H81_012697 [Sphagnurus paluster]|uniref:Uncharacterized protein n=1 Tax=Sphagnurus paluster TaxID=117069 RepID=A0A9P7FQF1_9AGAR|nr:hypothetical protein H0H81_012697 [Sphagnurus paluster]
MVELNRIFKASQQHRDITFREEDVRREDIYRKNDAAREVLFFQAQDRRAAAFRKGEDIRGERAAWYTAARKTLLLQGRQARKDTCAAIDASLEAQIGKFLKTQEELFVRAERTRDTLISMLLNDGITDRSKMNALEALRRPGTRLHNPTTPTSIEISIFPASSAASSYSQSPSLATMTRIGSRSTFFDRAQGHSSHTQKQSRSPSPETEDGPLDIPSLSPPDLPPNPETRDAPRQDPELAEIQEASGQAGAPVDIARIVDTAERGRSEQSRNFKDSLVGRFATTQQQREQVFRTLLLSLETRFQAAEALRDAAETQRTKMFERWERERERIVRSMIDAYGKCFENKENSRAVKGTRWWQVFDVTQEHHSQVFDISLSEVENQVDVEDNLEDDLVIQMKNARVSLSARQMARVDAAREDQLNRFKEAQRRRDADLLGSSSVSSLSVSLRKRRPPAYINPTTREEPHNRTKIPLSDSLIRPKGSSTLFRGASVNDPLPIPSPIDSPTADELPQDSLEDFRRSFERSQARWEEEFDKEMRRRRLLFRMNETKRQIAFERAQRERKLTFMETEKQNDFNFREALSLWDTAFQTAEDSRQLEFHREERQRNQSFRKAQGRRANKFYAKQKELQCEWFEAEQGRVAGLEAWGAEFLRARTREQDEICRGDEEDRDEIFKKWLRAFGDNVFVNIARPQKP